MRLFLGHILPCIELIKNSEEIKYITKIFPRVGLTFHVNNHIPSLTGFCAMHWLLLHVCVHLLRDDHLITSIQAQDYKEPQGCRRARIYGVKVLPGKQILGWKQALENCFYHVAGSLSNWVPQRQMASISIMSVFPFPFAIIGSHLLTFNFYCVKISLSVSLL